MHGVGGLSLPGGGGGSIEPSGGPPPKKVQLTGPPKTGPGTSFVRTAVVFVFKDTRPPVNSGYMYGTKSEVAHKRADWLHNPCRLGGPQQGDIIRSA